MERRAGDFSALAIVAKRYSILHPFAGVPMRVSMDSMPNWGATGFRVQAAVAAAMPAISMAVLMYFMVWTCFVFIVKIRKMRLYAGFPKKNRRICRKILQF